MCAPDGVDLVRRWVSALLLVPEAERPGVVAAIERRIAGAYAAGEEPLIHLRGPVVQRDGYIERIERTFTAASKPGRGAAKPRERRA